MGFSSGINTDREDAVLLQYLLVAVADDALCINLMQTCFDKNAIGDRIFPYLLLAEVQAGVTQTYVCSVPFPNRFKIAFALNIIP